jgi:hypothetical protein
MTFRHFFTFLGIVLGLTLVPAAQAANLFIDDSVEAQITLRHDANWEFGALSNGLPFGSKVSGNTTAPGEAAIFSGSWIVNSRGNPDPGVGIIYFVDQAKKDRCHHHHHHHHHGHHSLDQPRYQTILRNGGRGCGRHHRSDHDKGKKAVVSDIVTANWRTLGSTANISFTIVSSGCGRNLGRLPRHFAGFGVPDPASSFQIGGLFRNPATGAPVAIPSNLTVQFVGDDDTGCRRDHDDDDDD